MEQKQEAGKIFNNLFWRFAERCGAQLVSFVVSVVLARILEPKVYGTIALVMVFTAILQVFVDGGLGNALIQKKDADDLDFSTVFYFNLVMCIVIYTLTFLSAPIISGFYNMPELTPIIRALSLTIVISGIKNVQLAYVSRNLIFKKFFFATLGGTIGAAVVGISMALTGFGVWALVAQNLFNLIVDTVILWITVKWRPKKMFSFRRLKGLFSYGWKLLMSNLLNTFYNEIQSLVIGKKYTTDNLAFYNKGQQLPNLIITNVNTSIDSVLLPVMSNEQDNFDRMKGMTRRAIKTSTYIIAPLMMGLCFVSEPLIRILLTEKWLPCVPFLRIFCITYMFYPIHTANLNAIKAMGRSDLFLKLEIFKKVFGLITLIIAMNYGVKVIAYSLLLVELFSQIVNTWPNKKLLKYRYIDQLKDVFPGILLAVFMGICVKCVEILDLNDILTLFIQIPLGGMIYLLGSIVFKIDSFNYIKGILMPVILNKLKRKENHAG